MALRAKISPDEAEPEGFGGSKVEGENEVWPDFRRNPRLPARVLRAGMEAERDGASFPHFVVARRVSTSSTVRSSLLELSKTGSRRCPSQS
jgi:hypothetical protein